MTSQPQPDEGRSALSYLRPLRDLAAWALVGCPAVLLFVAVFRLIPSAVGEDFMSRTQDSFYSFVNLTTILFPLAAVLLALLVRPQHPKAKLITVIALGEYAVAFAFGVFFGFLLGLIRISQFSVRVAFEEFLVRLAWLAVIGLAAFAVLRIWRGLFFVAKPKPEPGMYGQPQYGVPGTYPGQPGYGPGPQGPGPQGQGPQGYGQPEQPAWNQPAQPHQPPPGTYGQQPYGQQQPPPNWGQPPASAPPASAPPAPPASSPPASAPPGPYAPEPGHAPGPYGSAQPSEPDRTQVFGEQHHPGHPPDQENPRY